MPVEIPGYKKDHFEWSDVNGICRPCDVTVKRMAPTEGTNLAGNDLELLPSLARCLPGLVVWYGLNVATFGGFSCSKRAV